MITLLLTLLAPRAEGCPPAAPLEAEIAALEIELASMQLQADIIRAQRIAAEGEATPWTEDISSDYRGEAVAAHLDALIDRSPMEVHLTGLDCSEWPCIAWLHGPTEEGTRQDGTPDDGIRWIASKATERYPHAERAHEGMSIYDDGQPGFSFAFVFFPDRPLARGEYERIVHRFGVLQEDAAEASGAVISEILSREE